ncbi:MAG: TonB-dependent receptor, partial [Flavobacteriales bacterium]|nr:TonB-dependent receptor [Flavobacteriales bacterium]
MKYSSITLVFFFLFTFGFTQNKFTIIGDITNSESGEELIGATIYVKELKTGTSANVYGFYSLTLPEGNYNISYSFLGCNTITKQVTLTEDIRINIELENNSTRLKEFEVTSIDSTANVSSTDMGIIKLEMKELETIPVLFGEKDILKTIQLLPGVSAAGEGNSGYYVRGGSTDQNLVLLDGAPVYNSSHLLGFFSVFNSDALKEVTLYKGGIPAAYGGRASSVLDVRMKSGNNKKFTTTAGIGLISSRLTIEGPIKKNESSFIISARRTYADLFVKSFGGEEFSDVSLYFWDLNVKANYKINDKNKVFLSGYFGKDVFGVAGIGFNWGNTTGTATWNHLFSNKLFMNSSIVYSKFNYEFGIERDGANITIGSAIEDWNGKVDFDYYLNAKNKMKFGINSIYHTFEPGALESEVDEFNSIILDEKYALESGIYFSNEQTLFARLKLTYGLRYSLFNVLGPGDVYTYDDENVITDTTSYSPQETIVNYGGFEPRISASYTINEKTSVKGSYNRMYQYLHQMSNSTSLMPTDIWLPSSEILKPQIADQYAVGFFKNLFHNKIEASIEGYYKNMQNQTDFEDGADILLNPKIESQILTGKGWSYGTELLIKKKYGLLTGWIGYTLSRTQY